MHCNWFRPPPTQILKPIVLVCCICILLSGWHFSLFVLQNRKHKNMIIIFVGLVVCICICILLTSDCNLFSCCNDFPLQFLKISASFVSDLPLRYFLTWVWWHYIIFPFCSSLAYPRIIYSLLWENSHFLCIKILGLKISIFSVSFPFSFWRSASDAKTTPIIIKVFNKNQIEV